MGQQHQQPDDWEVPPERQWVALDPSTPAGTLAELASDPDRRVRNAVAFNPSTPSPALAALADEFTAVAGNPSAAPDLLTDLTSRVDCAGSIAANPSTPLHVVAAIAVACGYDGPVDDRVRSVLIPTLEDFDRFDRAVRPRRPEGAATRGVRVACPHHRRSPEIAARRTRREQLARPGVTHRARHVSRRSHTPDFVVRNPSAPPPALIRAARFGPTWVCQHAGPPTRAPTRQCSLSSWSTATC